LDIDFGDTNQLLVMVMF